MGAAGRRKIHRCRAGAAGVGVGARDGLELLGELIGIVGEHVEVGAFEDEGVAVLLGAGVEGVVVGVDGDLLLLHFDDEGEGEAAGLAGLQDDVRGVKGAETGGGGGDGPCAGSEAVDVKLPALSEVAVTGDAPDAEPVMVMAAPGMTAPVGSTTVPLTEAVTVAGEFWADCFAEDWAGDCALAWFGEERTERQKRKRLHR